MRQEYTRYRRSDRAKTFPNERKTDKNSSLLIELQLMNPKTYDHDHKYLARSSHNSYWKIDF